MGYGKRIDTLCSLLTPVKVFADVGCDHGYCTEYMLKNELCERYNGCSCGQRIL